MDTKAQITCLWAGLVMVCGLGVGLITAGWLPPPDPDHSADEIAQLYLDDQDKIRVGILIAFFATPFALPFFVVVAMHMRVNGRWTSWSLVQLGCAALGLVSTLVACFLYLAATYQPEERTPGELQLLHDVGWLNLIGNVAPTIVQCAAIAAFVFTRDDQTALPRWAGYFNLWWALLLVPGLFVYCFDTGPLAWNGIFTFWLGAAFVAVWYPTMFLLLRRSIHAADQGAVNSGARDAIPAAS